MSYSKIKSANLCKTIYDIINYSTSICPFESGKCGIEGKKLQKFEYLENVKGFFDEMTFFIVFEGLSFDQKIKACKVLPVPKGCLLIAKTFLVSMVSAIERFNCSLKTNLVFKKSRSNLLAHSLQILQKRQDIKYVLQN